MGSIRFACRFNSAGITWLWNAGPINSLVTGTLRKKLERRHGSISLTSTQHIVLGLVLVLSAVIVGCAAISTPAPSTIGRDTSPATITEIPTKEQDTVGMVVRIGSLEFIVEVAADSDKQTKGLSGRASLDGGTGMLFVFENEKRFRFWMRGMEISLDMIWINSECRVVDVSENVPPPERDTPLKDLPRYSPESPAKYVLEINGGESEERGLLIGDHVEFKGELAGNYGC